MDHHYANVAPIFDTTLKLVLTDSPLLARELIGHCPIKTWLNVELPQVRNRRVDLLGETEGGDLIHIEIQRTNDAQMAARMVQYGLSIYDREGKFPKQIVLYFGEDPMRMPGELVLPGLSYQYSLMDIRDLDGDRLVDSAAIGDNIVGLLAGLRDPQGAVRRVLGRIAVLPDEQRDRVFQELTMVLGLRPRILNCIFEECEHMPIEMDIREHPLFDRGLQIGEQRGEQRGLQIGERRGEQRGERLLLRKQIEKKFGSIPPGLDEQLAELPLTRLEEIGLRLLDVSNLEDLL